MTSTKYLMSDIKRAGLFRYRGERGSKPKFQTDNLPVCGLNYNATPTIISPKRRIRQNVTGRQHANLSVIPQPI